MQVIEEISTYELERGKPMPNLTHGAIELNLGFELKLKLGSLYRVATEVSLATIPDGTTPDLVVYPKKQLNLVNEISKQVDAPLLTIEIQSPSQSLDSLIEKAHQYFAFGVKSSWIVIPSMKGIAVYHNASDYNFFHDSDILNDPNLNIEIELVKVFE